MYSINPTSCQVDHSEHCFNDECFDTYCMFLKLLVHRFVNVYKNKDLSMIDSSFKDIIDVTDIDNWNIMFATFRKAETILSQEYDFDKDLFSIICRKL